MYAPRERFPRWRPAASTVTFTARVRGRVVRASRRVAVSAGRWSVVLPLEGVLRRATAGTLTARYAGNAAVAPGTTVKTLKRR